MSTAYDHMESLNARSTPKRTPFHVGQPNSDLSRTLHYAVALMIRVAAADIQQGFPYGKQHPRTSLKQREEWAGASSNTVSVGPVLQFLFATR